MKSNTKILNTRFLLLAALLPFFFSACGDDAGDVSLQPGQLREYFISAEEVLWDYAPTGINGMSGEAFGEMEATFVAGNETDRIGKVYKKSVFKEYTDASFSEQKAIAPEWEHLGVMGPVLRAEVGDTIKVVFRNNTSIPASMHPHGVFYTKDSEGTKYNDNSEDEDKLDDVIQPGESYTYIWEVPERAGPGSDDPSSIVWLYHSHFNEPKDTNAGLVGAIIVTRRGEADAEAKPLDVDREFVTLFTVMDENQSWHLQSNIDNYAPQANPEDEDFQESNLMHVINGYVYSNLPGLEMYVGERVRWHLVALGTEVDLHTPHWHGATVSLEGHTTDVVELMPASMKSVDMLVDNPGTWMFHCHVNDHIEAGMMSLYTVYP